MTAVVKRALDLVLASLALVVLSPLLAAIWLAVRLSSPGPAVFRQERLGLGERPFVMYKFRSMRTGASDAIHREYVSRMLTGAGGPVEAANNGLFKLDDDPRVTPLGAWLRKTSLDELPQLLNVLRGEMSLVGPRPLTQRDYDLLEDWHRKRYLVLPGLTGLWQVSGRSELDFDELVRLDFLYLERWSVFLDLSILLKTIPAVLRARGAW